MLFVQIHQQTLVWALRGWREVHLLLLRKFFSSLKSWWCVKTRPDPSVPGILAERTLSGGAGAWGTRGSDPPLPRQIVRNVQSSICINQPQRENFHINYFLDFLIAFLSQTFSVEQVVQKVILFVTIDRTHPEGSDSFITFMTKLRCHTLMVLITTNAVPRNPRRTVTNPS